MEVYHKQKQKNITLSKADLQAFEDNVASLYDQALIHAPVHLSWGNEEQLIDIFQYVHPDDWVFSTWRNHYHALLHGCDPKRLMNEIMDCRSCSYQDPEHHFFTSAIVGGILPIAVGTALALKRQGSPRMVWCFTGDMTSESGVFYEAVKYAVRNELPIHFVVEDNELCTNTPTQETWGTHNAASAELDIYEDLHIAEYVTRYYYARSKYPHVCTKTWVQF